MENRMKFIVFHKGITETLAYFSSCIARELEALGHEVFRFEIRDDTVQLPELVRFLEQGEVTLLTFNFHGIQGEAIFYHLENPQNNFNWQPRLLWDIYKVRCINILVDHPLYYYRQFDMLPENYTQICIDGDHENYMKKIYPHIRLLPAMPLAGSSPWNATILEKTDVTDRQQKVPWVPKRM